MLVAAPVRVLRPTSWIASRATAQDPLTRPGVGAQREDPDHVRGHVDALRPLDPDHRGVRGVHATVGNHERGDRQDRRQHSRPKGPPHHCPPHRCPPPLAARIDCRTSYAKIVQAPRTGVSISRPLTTTLRSRLPWVWNASRNRAVARRRPALGTEQVDPHGLAQRDDTVDACTDPGVGEEISVTSGHDRGVASEPREGVAEAAPRVLDIEERRVEPRVHDLADPAGHRLASRRL